MLVDVWLLFLGVVGVWLVDIGQIGLSQGFRFLSNNFWSLSPGVVYHVGMYLVLLVVFAFGLLNITFLGKFEED